MSETWRPIPGFVGLYEVSDHGRVRSLPRTITRRDGLQRRVTGGFLGARSRGGDRPSVTLHRPDLSVRRYVHQLVLEAFVGPRPAPGMEACHNDGNPTNNALTNLRWDTKSENQRDAVRHGTHVNTRKKHCSAGHPLSGDNLAEFRRANGRVHRSCRTCKSTRDRLRPPAPDGGIQYLRGHEHQNAVRIAPDVVAAIRAAYSPGARGCGQNVLARRFGLSRTTVQRIVTGTDRWAEFADAAPTGRCTAVFTTPYGDRRCDLTAGHDGVHIRNDGAGRPEYYWRNDAAPTGQDQP